MNPRGRHVGTVGTVASIMILCASHSWAQGSPKWEVEVHGGGALSGNPTAGNSSLPPAGESFFTAVGAPSRRASSWYFGDGARLLNEINTGLFALGRITPLDSTLNAAITKRGNGGTVGARVGRVLNSRLKAELSIDYTRGSVEITSDVRDAVEATRASFITAWNSIIATGPFLSPRTTSTATMSEGSGPQLMTVGALTINLTRPGRLTPYVTAGGGVLSDLGDEPSIALAGEYGFLIIGLFPITERDVVTVRYSAPERRAVGVIGGGLTYDVAARSGLRVDVRAYLTQNRATTSVSASPEVVTQAPAFFIASFSSPSLQFSNNPALARSTLSGARIEEFATFEGSGMQRNVAVTAGWFWRF